MLESAPDTFGVPCARPAFADLTDQDGYLRWRDWKLHQAATRLEELVVEVRDPRHLSSSEHGALMDRCRRMNMALYASPLGNEADKAIPRLLGAQLGLTHLDHNWLADDDGITSLAVHSDGARPHYIPYTDRAIHWHTDGYYNSGFVDLPGGAPRLLYRARYYDRIRGT